MGSCTGLVKEGAVGAVAGGGSERKGEKRRETKVGRRDGVEGLASASFVTEDFVSINLLIS